MITPLSTGEGLGGEDIKLVRIAKIQGINLLVPLDQLD